MLATQDVAKDSIYLAKYKNVMTLMRVIPDDDPRSLTQQAKVHYSYWDDEYQQVGSKMKIQVHSCSVFYLEVLKGSC